MIYVILAVGNSIPYFQLNFFFFPLILLIHNATIIDLIADKIIFACHYWKGRLKELIFGKSYIDKTFHAFIIIANIIMYSLNNFIF